jgi:hypothetical protein
VFSAAGVAFLIDVATRLETDTRPLAANQLDEPELPVTAGGEKAPPSLTEPDTEPANIV